MQACWARVRPAAPDKGSAWGDHGAAKAAAASTEDLLATGTGACELARRRSAFLEHCCAKGTPEDIAEVRQ